MNGLYAPSIQHRLERLHDIIAMNFYAIDERERIGKEGCVNYATGVCHVHIRILLDLLIIAHEEWPTARSLKI
jgi:hypothetical protein